MPDSNTTTGTAATDDPLVEAYLAGVRYGVAYGSTMAMTPGQKDLAGYREAKVQARLEAGEAAVARIRDRHADRRYWPIDMPGGWPLPPGVPSDDPTDWWHEVDGWPCPPPELRGGAS